MQNVKTKFWATVKNGKLEFKDQISFIKHIASQKDGSDVWVTIGSKRKERSLNQNAWYWGVVLAVIAEETGHTAEELHEIFKRMFLPPRVVTYKEKELKIASSTANLNTLEFSQYIERIRAEAGTMGITIPDPSQVDCDWM